MVIINYRFLIILSFIFIIKSSKLKEDDELYLIHVEYQYNISKYNFPILNKDEAEINEFLSSRVAFLSDKKSGDEIFDLYCNYINKYWLFVVNSTDVANYLLKKDDYKKNELFVNGIIVPKSLGFQIPKDNNNKNIPVFEVGDNFTDYFNSIDIRNMEKHIYFIFEIKRAISSYPEVYLLIISILCLLISIAMFIFWKILMTKTRHIYILSIHKILYSIPFFLLLLSISLLIKAIDIKGQDPYREYEDSVYIDTALITLDAIYRTLLWFLILLMCCGWKISIQNLNREDLKFLMKMFLIIYISMCLDQIMDSASSGIWVFHLSEIKNIIFYIIMLFVLLKKIRNTIFFLERRLYYARALSLEYVEALVYKVNLIKKFKKMLYSYLVIYIILIFIHKVIVSPYDTTLLEVYNYSLVDLYLSIYFLYLLRPKELPPNFNIDFGNDIEGDIGIVYKAFLPKYNDINERKEDNQKELLSCKGKNIPILVLGPCLSHYNMNGEEEYSINNYLNNVEVGFAN
jgi:hypothetical protein